MTAPVRAALALAVAALALPGCSGSVDTTYGRSRPPSVNGTAVLADLFRARGHEVRSAVRLTDELGGWADVLVRFAQTPGPPSREEAEWYSTWLDQGPGRSLVYVPRDYDAAPEYWDRAREQLPPDAPERTVERIAEARKEAGGWEVRLPPPAKSPALAEQWFAVEGGKTPVVCRTLGGPWAAGVDPAKAALTRHQTLKVDSERVLLSGDDKPLVIDWGDEDEGGRVLVAASGTFLLNFPLTEKARRPLAVRTVRWAEGVDGGEDVEDEEGLGPLRVAFVEGSSVLSDVARTPSVFALLKVSPFGMVAAQLFALGLAGCLARAPRLGRPRPDEPSGADRPVAHPEALGALLARTRQARAARTILDAYRRWRGSPPGRDAPRAGT